MGLTWPFKPCPTRVHMELSYTVHTKNVEYPNSCLVWYHQRSYLRSLVSFRHICFEKNDICFIMIGDISPRPPLCAYLLYIYIHQVYLHVSSHAGSMWRLEAESRILCYLGVDDMAILCRFYGSYSQYCQYVLHVFICHFVKKTTVFF